MENHHTWSRGQLHDVFRDGGHDTKVLKSFNLILKFNFFFVIVVVHLVILKTTYLLSNYLFNLPRVKSCPCNIYDGTPLFCPYLQDFRTKFWMQQEFVCN